MVRGQTWSVRAWKDTLKRVKQQKEVRGGAWAFDDHIPMLKSTIWTIYAAKSLQAFIKW